MCDLKPGPIIGALKGRIEDAILDGVIPYDRQAACEYLMKIKDAVIATDPAQLLMEGRKRAQWRRNINSKFEFPIE